MLFEYDPRNWSFLSASNMSLGCSSGPTSTSCTITRYSFQTQLMSILRIIFNVQCESQCIWHWTNGLSVLRVENISYLGTIYDQQLLKLKVNIKPRDNIRTPHILNGDMPMARSPIILQKS